MMESIAVSNAGLVLANSYLPMLFERLELTSEGRFISEQAQLEAVHYCQYIVSGQSETQEYHLSLNKIICGLKLDEPIFDSITITEDQRALIEGLIKAMISYWSSIGTSSVDGFRGNWLVREGILSEESDHFSLTIEKRAYDVLLIKAPFSFSIIKFPWMSKPLHVTWPY